MMQLVHKTIEKFGKNEVRPDEWIDHVIAGLEDSQNSVREAALKAIEGIYKYVNLTPFNMFRIYLFLCTIDSITRCVPCWKQKISASFITIWCVQS